LVFNDEIDAYQGWTLFAITLSILVLIGGVMLLTTKKPDPNSANATTAIGAPSRARAKNSDEESVDERETEVLHQSTPGERPEPLWQIGDDDDDDDRRGPIGTTSLSPKINRTRANSGSLRSRSSSYLPPKHEGEEGRGLMGAHDEDDEDDAETPTAGPQRGQNSRERDDDDEFESWDRASVTGSPRARR
jgi:hypothetical protein